MVRERIEREKFFDRGQEIVRHGAADAAIGELDDILGAAGEIAAAVQNFRVDADVAKFVDDEGNAAPLGILQEVANEGRLPRAKKAGDDRCRDFGMSHERAPGSWNKEGAAIGGAGRTRILRRRRASAASIDERPERPAGLCSIERQVSWLADHRLTPPSQVAVARIPVAYRRKATR
jgi:hypothetical protein